MAPANRASLTDTKKFLIAALAVIGVFVVCYGAGLSNTAVVGLGLAVFVLGPALILFTNARSNARQMEFGTAHVHEMSPPPAAGATGRSEMELIITARGINGVAVRVRDNAVPVNKWPDVGATLPVMVSAGDARKVRILWDQVRTHGEVAVDDHLYPRYTADFEDPNLEPADSPSYDHGPFPPEEEPELDVIGLHDMQIDQAELDGAGLDPDPFTPRTYIAPDTGRRDRRGPPRPYRREREEPAPVSPSTYAVPEGGMTVATIPGPVGPEPVIPEPAPVPDPVPIPDPMPIPDPAVPEPVPIPDPPPMPEPAAEPVVPELDPADELEPDPLPDGAIAKFLAAGPQRAQPLLAGVSGVSVTLIVADLGRSLRFYRDTLGLTELDSAAGSAVLASGDARVVLRRVADMPPVDRRVVHLNLEVQDVYEAYERLRSQGVEFVHRPRVVPQGEQLELCTATFRDPDGHAIALSRWEIRR